MSESSGPGPPGGISDELRPYVDSTEAEAIDLLAERLEAEPPLLSATFRGELRARLDERAGVANAWRPRRLRRLVAAYVGSGLLLLVVAAIGLSGAGPLGY
jgi:hypothetical protein